MQRLEDRLELQIVIDISHQVCCYGKRDRVIRSLGPSVFNDLQPFTVKDDEFFEEPGSTSATAAATGN
ncbi:hypothetical protein COCOBI_01-0310 [Coccomyxa sp. Obi]|nr:hypothetical protein COCOBI_01-0310 [Coccomyxa sp. Obi]